jgi:hypothetical protein
VVAEGSRRYPRRVPTLVLISLASGLLLGAMVNIGIRIRRRIVVRRFRARAAASSVTPAENGYRGLLAEQVPIDPANPPRMESDGFLHRVSTAQLARTRATGDPVQAVCGRVWIPGGETAALPLCPRCDEVFAAMPAGPRRH